MTVTQETAKKIGLFTALSILIGSVVGIGIFLKNIGVFRENGYNPTGILLSWVVGAVIALTTAYCFSEIGSSKNSRSGLAGWAEQLLGKKAGYFIKISFPIFYLSIMEVVLSVFLAESIFRLFTTGIKDVEIHFGFVVLLGLILMSSFIFFNYWSLKSSGIFSSITTILKFIPIIVIIIVGFTISIQKQSNGLFDYEINSILPNEKTIKQISFAAIFSSLPAILFAFDSFTNIGNLALDIKKPEKNVSLAIIIGMTICSVFYIIFTISQILVIEPNGLKFFENDFFSKNIQFPLLIVMNIFIVISMSGVVNSFSAASIKSFASLIEEKIIFCHRFYSSLSNKFPKADKTNLRSGMLLLLSTTLTWSLIICIPAMCVGTIGSDAFLDGISNFPVVFFFFVYGVLVLGALINRFTNKVPVKKEKFFLAAAPLSLIGIFSVSCYLLLYQYLIFPFTEGKDKKLSWGLFYDNGFEVDPWVGSIWFFISLLLFITLPLLNQFIIKLNNKDKQESV